MLLAYVAVEGMSMFEGSQSREEPLTDRITERAAMPGTEICSRRLSQTGYIQKVDTTRGEAPTPREIPCLIERINATEFRPSHRFTCIRSSSVTLFRVMPRRLKIRPIRYLLNFFHREPQHRGCSGDRRSQTPHARYLHARQSSSFTSLKDLGETAPEIP